MAADVVVFTLAGGALGVPAALVTGAVDVQIDAPFVVAVAAALGAATKWVHGLWRTRKIYREHMLRNTIEHENTLNTLSGKMDEGFTKLAARLDAQDRAMENLTGNVDKAVSTADAVFTMMVDLEGRNNARFEALDR